MPQRIVGYGRFRHEAAAIDPATHVCYLTEDRERSAFYRFVPVDPADPFTGQLQALRVLGADRFLTTQMRTGQSVEIDWVDIGNADPMQDNVRRQAQDVGGAVVSRGEGLWFHDGAAFFTATEGGPAGAGQVFRLQDGGNRGVLQCLVASEDPVAFAGPDNLTVAPWGQPFVCEDKDGVCQLQTVSLDGQVVPFGRNAVSDSELAGVCFSPDGQLMFVNLQEDGLTLVVRGPFPVA